MLDLSVKDLMTIALSGIVLAASAKAWATKKLKAVRISRSRQRG